MPAIRITHAPRVTIDLSFDLGTTPHRLRRIGRLGKTGGFRRLVIKRDIKSVRDLANRDARVEKCKPERRDYVSLFGRQNADKLSIHAANDFGKPLS